jgi:hypothetical protein
VALNHQIKVKNALSQAILESLELLNFKSNGLRLVVEHDTVDNLNSPKSASHLQLNNIAFRETLYGGESLETFNGK